MMLNGLDLTKTYDLRLYSQTGPAGADNTDFRVTDFNGASAVKTAPADGVTTSVLFTGLKPVSNATYGGILTVDWGWITTAADDARGTTDFASFNGFTLTQVPEPSSFALLGAGACIALLRRRRSR